MQLASKQNPCQPYRNETGAAWQKPLPWREFASVVKWISRANEASKLKMFKRPIIRASRIWCERTVRKQSDPMHSNHSRGTLMSCGDHSAQRRFKSNAPINFIHGDNNVFGHELQMVSGCPALMKMPESTSPRPDLLKLTAGSVVVTHEIQFIMGKSNGCLWSY